MNLATCQFHGGRRDEHGLLVFCGQPSVVMYSYCETHRPLIFIKTRPRDPDQVDRLATFKRTGANHG